MSNIYPINTSTHLFLHFVSLFIVVWCLVKFGNIRKHFWYYKFNFIIIICYLFEYHKDRTIQFFVCSLAEKAPNALFHLKTTSMWNFYCCVGLKALWRVGVVDKGSIYIVHRGKVENAAELSGFILYYSFDIYWKVTTIHHKTQSDPILLLWKITLLFGDIQCVHQVLSLCRHKLIILWS